MRLRATLLACTAAAALTLSACSSSGSTAAGTAPSTSAPSAAPSAAGSPSGAVAPSEPAPQGSSAAPEASKPAPPADAGLPPAPDAAATAKLVAALDAIDPDIVAGKPEKAVEAARNQCQAVFSFPKDRQKLIDLTNQRFTSAKHPEGFGAQKAEQILTALQADLCPAPR